MSKPATLTVRVSPSMRATIDRYAQARGMSAGEFVRYAVWTYIDSTPPNEDEEIAENLSSMPESGLDAGELEIGEIRRG